MARLDPWHAIDRPPVSIANLPKVAGDKTDVDQIHLRRASDEPETFRMVVVNPLNGARTTMLYDMTEAEVRDYLSRDGFPADFQAQILSEARLNPAETPELFSVKAKGATK